MTNKTNIQSNKEYRDWLFNLKSKIQSAQQKAAISVNKELIKLYYFIGKELFSKQQKANWGDKVLQAVSKDLKAEFPDLKGFSITNLKYMRSFYIFYSNNSIGQQAVDLSENGCNEIGQQAVDQLEKTRENQFVPKSEGQMRIIFN